MKGIEDNSFPFCIAFFILLKFLLSSFSIHFLFVFGIGYIIVSFILTVLLILFLFHTFFFYVYTFYLSIPNPLLSCHSMLLCQQSFYQLERFWTVCSQFKLLSLFYSKPKFICVFKILDMHARCCRHLLFYSKIV